MKNKQTAPNPISRGWWAVLIVASVVNVAAHLAVFSTLPERVPIHWGAGGNVDGYGSRSVALFLDVLPLLLLAFFWMVPRMDPKGEAYDRSSRFYTGFVVAFTVMMSAFTWVTELTCWGVLPQNQSPVGAIICVSLGFLFMGMGNYLPRVRSNYTFGVKTPWALADERNWVCTQRAGGVCMVVLGVGFVLLGLASYAVPGCSSFAVPVLLAFVVFGVGTPYAYSYLLWRKRGHEIAAPRATRRRPFLTL